MIKSLLSAYRAWKRRAYIASLEQENAAIRETMLFYSRRRMDIAYELSTMGKAQ